MFHVQNCSFVPINQCDVTVPTNPLSPVLIMTRVGLNTSSKATLPMMRSA
jgi:hypothetical protein